MSTIVWSTIGFELISRPNRSPPRSTIGFEFRVDLPPKPFADTLWFAEVFRIRPMTDEDGVVIDTTVGTYPYGSVGPFFRVFWDAQLPTRPKPAYIERKIMKFL